MLEHISFLESGAQGNQVIVSESELAEVVITIPNVASTITIIAIKLNNGAESRNVAYVYPNM